MRRRGFRDEGPARFLPLRAEVDDFAFVSSADYRRDMGFIQEQRDRGVVLRKEGHAPIDDSRIEPSDALTAREEHEHWQSVVSKQLGRSS